MNGKKKSNKREDEKNVLNRNPHHRSIATTHSCRHASSLSACRYTQTLKLSFYVFYYSERRTAKSVFMCIERKNGMRLVWSSVLGCCERFFGCAKIALDSIVAFVIRRQPIFRSYNRMVAKVGSFGLAKTNYASYEVLTKNQNIFLLKSELRLIPTRYYLLIF